MDLFETQTKRLQCHVHRNIISSSPSINVFEDLDEGDPVLNQVAIQSEMGAKSEVPSGMIARAFHYSEAVERPFVKENWNQSRFSDGSFGVWYGSLEEETAICESAYHTIKFYQAFGMNKSQISYRAMYQVLCQAVLLDFVGKEKSFPDLISNDYLFTQTIGKRLSREGHPGIITPSARCSGSNINIFHIAVLSQPKLNYNLNYHYDPSRDSIQIEKKKAYLKTIKWQEFGREYHLGRGGS